MRFRYEPSALAAVQAGTIPESESVAGKHPLVAWKILKDKSAERFTADAAAAGIETTKDYSGLFGKLAKDYSGKLLVNGIKEDDINTAVKLLTYTAQTSEDDAAGRVIACRITSIKNMSGSGAYDSGDEYPEDGERSFKSSVAVGGEIFLVGSKSAPLVFSMSVDISYSEHGSRNNGFDVQDQSDSVSFEVKDPNNVACDIFNGGSDFDPDEKVAAIQQQPARVFGPDKITDKEIRLLTLKEWRDCCSHGGAGYWDEDEAGPLLALLVDACGECVGEDGIRAWETWAGC